MRRIVISGVTGHVGQELARQLAHAGYEVHGLIRHEQPVERPISRSTRLHVFGEGTEQLVDLFRNLRPEAVIHLAALARREHLIRDITPFINANIMVGTQLLEAARQSQCPRFIAAGSYLQHAHDGAFGALNFYAATKLAFANILAYYADAFGLCAAELILCNVYSEHETRPTLITDMAAAGAEGRAVTLHGGEAWVDPVHVEDVAAAFIHTLQLMESHQAPCGEVRQYSVTSGSDVSASQLAELLEKLLGRPMVINRSGEPTSSRRARPWRGESVPGWQPAITLEAGIARLLDRVRARARHARSTLQ
jgi:nucleoside-diphosphate-sugar epimerase